MLESFYPNVGGVEHLFYQLANKLVESGWKVTILTARPYVKTNSNEAQHVFSSVTIPFRSRYLFTLFAFVYCLFLVPRNNIVHTTTYNAAIPAYLVSKVFNKKCIVTFHEYWGRLWFEFPFLSSLQRWLYFYFEKAVAKLKFDKFVAVSNYTKGSLITAGVDYRRILTIYNGIDYDQYPQKPIRAKKNMPFRFLFVGRAGISKGLNILVDAVKLLRGREVEVIIQSPDTRQFGVLARIQAVVVKKRLQDVIVFKKEKLSSRELVDLMLKVDCLVVPSYSEGFCFSAVEACAIGLPVIHSGRGALKEVVSGRYLIFDKMKPRSLALKLEKAIKGEFVSQKLNKFELATTVSKYIELYEKLI